ncbi:methylated-DNA--[protein]-cysteine S-methyltransferase [Pseudoruegeria sp. SHC-113]|uniref:methylated-DNA--[protein]-cysteine S-methyltransferase n=1 Tax=Pseudoruegeria sp. SHC-113 TaxID=2855439 RepID=UPI0021BB6CE7|nr:methylated-DNA--[protein]-cysteine S-methyltransferase [Pseudoruegeria sp. SHC-113]MCT8161000.1 methylated-DNA--[protein]-cysteine S-methyltransferase [Pseudoruegeria sp. SHC-113]
MLQASFHSPLGPLTLTEKGGAIIALSWHGDAAESTSPLLAEAAAQLAAYFAGDLTDFDLPLRVEGSAFQQAVCAQMRAIPYGQTRTYGDLAKALGHPAQAVGGACGGNPIPILIPCHRVVGAGGLTGFSGAGGVETKAALLRLEGALLI